MVAPRLGETPPCHAEPVARPMSRVILIRHGETEWNRSRRRQGQLDSPLTADGRRHAEAAANACGALGIDSVFSSPLGRAYTTATIVGARLGKTVEIVDELAEVHHGTLAGLTNEEIEARHPGELDRRDQQKYTWTFPGGESYADADVRAARALEAVAAGGAKVPLLVTHEMIGRMLLRSLLGLTPDEALDLSMPHGSVLEVLPADGQLTIHRATDST